jgi:polysaccharide export outer membrane protein
MTGTKSLFSMRLRAAFLCGLTFFANCLVPVLAASPSESYPDPKGNIAQNSAPTGQLQATPAMELVAPPPADAPALDGQPSPVPPVFSSPELPKLKWVPSVESSYILGPGDQLTIADYSSSDSPQPVMQPVAPILPDGTIDIHPVGLVKAAGLTLKELTESVNKLAAQYIIKPDIEVSVVKVRPNMVYILGEVLRPGLYTNEANGLLQSENVVSASANLTVVNALQRAGGIKESADIRNLRITRLGGREPIRSNLWQLLVNGDITQDIALQSGDVLYVPKGGSDFDADALGLAANQHRRVRIWGAVRSPGFFEMDPSDDVISLIARAGGFTNTATRSWVLLSRINRDGTITTRKISVKRGIHDPDSVARTHLKPGDLVVVHDSLLKKGAGTLYQQTVYFMYAIGLITYAIYLGNAVNKNNGNNSGTSTAIPVTTPTTSSTSSGISP